MKKCIEYIVFVVVLLVGRGEEGTASVSAESVSDSSRIAYRERAKKYRIPTFVFNREEFRNPDKVFRQLQEQEIDFIVLAGFLWLMPSFITAAWPNKIVNIHPALLPAYGGKGMYGHHVHEAVIAAGEKESGITIHYVNDHYDQGAIIFQAKCPVLPTDTPDDLAARVHELEYRHFPRVIEDTLKKL